MRILIGTKNQHKVKEIKDLLPEYDIVTPKEEGINIDVEENGNSFEENAEIKARAFQKISGMVTLADDSGLQVDCLNGAPGIYSARYSPKPDATDADRREFLLKNIKNKKAEKPWKGRFYCAIAVVDPDGRIYLTNGSCEGAIIETECGNGGFGYDPIFYVPQYQMTLAEMTEEQKNSISHRGNAIRRTRLILEKIIDNGRK